MTVWLLLALSLLLMVACGVFVAAEFSFVTVDRPSVERAAADGDRRAAGVLAGLRTLSTQLSGAQLGITITNLAIGFLAEPAIGELLRGPLEALGITGASLSATAYLVALLLSTFVTMLVGELIPKNLALAVPMGTAKTVQAAQRGFTAVMAWPIRGLNGSANALLRAVGIEPQEELRSARSPYELRSLVLRSADEGSLEHPTADLVARSIAFGDRTAADVRTPRVRVRFLDGSDTADDLLGAVRDTGHSRFPVVGRDLDDLLGVVHVTQAVAVAPDRRRSVRLRDLAVPAVTVPDSVELDPLLTVLRDADMQIAVVLDEYGGTDGVVTLEDLVEEIVGDIADEHDRAFARLRSRPDGIWVLSGMLRPDEVQDLTGVPLPEGDDYETVAGLLVQRLGRLPEVGAVVELAVPVATDDQTTDVGVRLRVDRMDGRRVDRVVLEITSADEGEAR
ncbi:CBS domain containing-hemolysin-like protein [Mumia flava]|uniref:CBS domain containing-hemolysin-like protein n=1 Tax=Mumia flava TaxID=1348852 RepID=A0A0B2BRN5_9ACTN|nr:hemolysin family protein [Mumia flava]PJJ56915.1 CBS domain containing-hemolysin-like protein [Mumia flava]